MKKSLIAIAALAAAGAASAQSSVTLYGVVDTSYGYLENYNAGVRTGSLNINPTNLSGSRFGLKGQEDLGNGLAAVFNVEAGFSSADGQFTKNGASAIGFSRRAVVGVKGSFGQVVIGRDYTPLDTVLGGTYHAIDAISLPYTARRIGIHYAGNFSGVGLNAMASYGDQRNGSTVAGSSQGYGIAANYASGPFGIGAGVQHFRDRVAGVTVAETTEYGIGASYDFSAAKILGYYSGIKTPGIPAWQQFGLGVTAPIGAFTLGAQYAYNYQSSTNKGHNFGVQGVYSLSKRTDVYARAMRHNAWGNNNVYQTVFAAGVRHKF